MSSSKVDFIASHTLTFSPQTKFIRTKSKMKKSKTVIQSKKPQLVFPASTTSTCSSIEFSQVGAPLIQRRTLKHFTHCSLKSNLIKKKRTTESDECTETDDITEVNDSDECIDTKINCYLFTKKESNEYLD